MSGLIYRQGKPLMIDYDPVAAGGNAIAAGDVVLVGTRPHVFHSSWTSGIDTKMAAASSGGCVYDCPKVAGGGTAITAGTKIYWDDANSRITTTANANLLGRCVKDASDDATWVLVEHQSSQV